MLFASVAMIRCRHDTRYDAPPRHIRDIRHAALHATIFRYAAAAMPLYDAAMMPDASYHCRVTICHAMRHFAAAAMLLAMLFFASAAAFAATC